VNALALDAAGNLYAVGSFTAVGVFGANNVARWNGSVWSALGAGANDTVSAVSLSDSGQLFVTGRFTSPGNGVAMWNGTTWVDLNAAGPNRNFADSVVIAPDSGEITIGVDNALLELRPAVFSASQSSAAGDTTTGDVYLSLLSPDNSVSYLRWSDSTQTWDAPVVLDAVAATSRVGMVFDSGTGVGAALWRGVDGNIYKKDFSESGSVAASADLVASGWIGSFMASESGDGNLFTLFGRNPSWLLQRIGFALVGP
jgi:hypothetical protein